MAKAAKAKAAQADVGHNSEAEEALERKRVFMEHYLPIAAQLEVVKAAQADYKKLRKLAKAASIVLSDIDFAMKCAEVEDENVMIGRMKREAEIAAWFSLPVYFQPDMFGDFGAEHGEDRARREGASAGLTGKGSNPYDENSDLGKAWAGEWSKEQAIHRAAMQADMERRNAEKGQESELIGQDNDPSRIAAE